MNKPTVYPTVYIETTIPSYLTARPTIDVVALARQVETIEWWDNYRQNFRLVISRFVLDEASVGNVEAAQRRLAVLQGIEEIKVNETIDKLAQLLITTHSLPAKSYIDAYHIATAATHGIDYLLTWNCKHIANATMRGQIEKTCLSMGVKAPILCTPSELKNILVNQGENDDSNHAKT